jgi:hypothetical protein
MRRPVFTPRRVLLFAVVLPAVALTRYFDDEPAAYVFGTIGLVGCAVGIGWVMIDVARKRRRGDE